MTTPKAPKHLYVVNDVPELLDLFRELLESEGYRVTLDRFAAVGLNERLERVKAGKPDLMILDFLVGGESLGWQLLQMLKMDRATTGLPIVVCTAAVHTVRELHAHLVTMDVEVVLKPFDVDQLLAAITRAFERAEVNAKSDE
ncbi:MAG: response regulator [Thermomicrobiales bacterium]